MSRAANSPSFVSGLSGRSPLRMHDTVASLAPMVRARAEPAFRFDYQSSNDAPRRGDVQFEGLLRGPLQVRMPSELGLLSGPSGHPGAVRRSLQAWYHLPTQGLNRSVDMDDAHCD